VTVRPLLAPSLAALVAALSLVTTPSVSAATSDDRVATEVEVRPGDNLTLLARRNGVSVDDLRRWNRSKIGKSDFIRAGDTLVVMLPKGSPEAAAAEAESGTEWVGYYDIKRGDTLSGVAAKLGVSMAELRHWNNLGKDAIIRAGRTLRYKKHGERPRATSVGTTTRGRLHNAVRLGPGPGYRLRFPKNTYTIPSVVKTLTRCTARMKRRFKGTADILIGDLSRATGGRFPPHVSHQSGRDADVGYYIVGNVQNKTMYRLKSHDVDYEKTWELLLCFLAEDEVVRVFMDTPIQKRMAKYLEETKRLDARRIDRLFAAVGDITDSALIQHAPNHDTHLHVRFACEPEDRECAEDPGEKPFSL